MEKEKDPEQHSFLGDILKSSHEEALLFFKKEFNLIADEAYLQIILVTYREATDSIIFWSLYPFSEDRVGLISNINIRNGEGSVGFILRSKQPEIVYNTSKDPRGSIALVDDLIGNISWFGVPIFHKNDDKNDIKFIISFSYNEEDFWPNEKAIDIKYKTKEIIVKYIRELELLNEIKTIRNLQKIFLDKTTDNHSLIERISAVANETTSYSYILYKQDNQIKDIKINETIVENRISTFLNWCELFSNKCSNCPAPSTTHDKNNCKYYSDFLKYGGDNDDRISSNYLDTAFYILLSSNTVSHR